MDEHLGMPMIVELELLGQEACTNKSKAFECAARLPSGKVGPTYVSTSSIYSSTELHFLGSRYHFFPPHLSK